MILIIRQDFYGHCSFKIYVKHYFALNGREKICNFECRGNNLDLIMVDSYRFLEKDFQAEQKLFIFSNCGVWGYFEDHREDWSTVP